jgi:hypothetical protein
MIARVVRSGGGTVARAFHQDAAALARVDRTLEAVMATRQAA